MPAPRSALPPFFIRTVAGLAALAVAGAITVALILSRPEPEERPAGEDVRRVTVVNAFDAPVGRRWRGYGTVKPVRSADVPARIEATVVALGPDYRAGERVERGALLLELDDNDFRRRLLMTEDALASIEARLALLVIDAETAREAIEISEREIELAETDLKRAERALAEGAAVEREVDRLRQTVLLARRTLMFARETERKLPARRADLEAERSGQQSAKALAQLFLERCRIESPLDGVLQHAEVRVGEIVRIGERVARVVDPSELEIEIHLPSTSRETVRVGDRMLVTPERRGAEPIELAVRRIVPEDDVGSRTVRVFAETRVESERPAAETPPEQGRAPLETWAPLAPGVFVTAEVEGAVDRARTLVPRRALNEGRILVVIDGRVHARQVTVDFHLTGSPPGAPIADREWAVLRELLPPETQIVLDGSRQLREGSTVIAVPAQRGEAAALAAPDASEGALR